MVLIRCCLPLAGLVLLVCGNSAFAGIYVDPSGFSFTLPDRSVVITRAELAKPNSTIPPELKAWVTAMKADFEQTPVMVVLQSPEEYPPNLSVQLVNRQGAINEAEVKTMIDGTKEGAKIMGMKIENVQGRLERFGNHDTIFQEYRIHQQPTVPELRQRQVMFAGGGKSYVITCTSKLDTFDAHKATFDQVLTSFQMPVPINPMPVPTAQLPAPANQGFDWNRPLVTALIGGVIGGLIGLLIWLARVAGIIKTPQKPDKPLGESNSPGT